MLSDRSSVLGRVCRVASSVRFALQKDVNSAPKLHMGGEAGTLLMRMLMLMLWATRVPTLRFL